MSNELDLNVISVEIAKLRLGPDDVLVVKTVKPYTARDYDTFRRLVHPSKVIWIDEGVQLSVITHEEGVDDPAPAG